MTPRLPVVSGTQTMAVLKRLGYEVVRQKGSHVRMRHPDASAHRPTTIPLHRELRVGLLRAILRDTGLSPDEFRELLGRQRLTTSAVASPSGEGRQRPMV